MYFTGCWLLLKVRSRLRVALESSLYKEFTQFLGSLFVLYGQCVEAETNVIKAQECLARTPPYDGIEGN